MPTQVSPKQNDSTSVREAFDARCRRIVNQIHAATNFNQILIGLKDEMSKLFGAEQVTVYLVDARNKEIFSRIEVNSRPIEIRIPVNSSSIAGHVASTARGVNIRDARNKMGLMAIDPDLSFDRSWDKKSGFITQQVLAVPIVFGQSLLGVIQLINKKEGGQFDPDDERRLADIAETLGIAFHNQYRLTHKIPPRYELLIRNGIVTERELVQAHNMARRKGVFLEEVLVEDFRVAREELGNALATYYGIPYENLDDKDYNPLSLIAGTNIEYFRKEHWIPLAREDDRIIVAINEPDDHNKLQEIRQLFRAMRVELHFALIGDIERFINSFFAQPRTVNGVTGGKSFGDILEEMRDIGEASGAVEEESETRNIDDSATVMLARKIIEDAYQQGASDIHIEPYGMKHDAEVRLRVDGQCAKVLTIPRIHSRAVISRFKIMAKLDISERRKPQDGKIQFKTGKGKNIELRMATIPTVGGNEDVVLRILTGSKPLPLKKIMPSATFDRFAQIIHRPYGIIMVVGPTGSGKTTTLHSALGFINTSERKIWTAEDPVEITQQGLRQVQVNPKIGFNFATAMRAFLRADPDVIMVGEMRDQETVKMGIEAALTGHLVFSTLHTNSAPETIIRLVDMGMDPFNFADALLGILAQRLVRTICPTCKEAYYPTPEEYGHLRAVYGDFFADRVNIPYSNTLKIHRGAGCDRCKNTGYKGRMGLYELLLGSDAIKRLIISRQPVEAIRQSAVQEGMTTLLQDGIYQVFQGQTDIHQVTAVCSR